MPGSAIGITFPYGYPGSFAREADCIIRTRPVKAATADINFGDAVVLDSTGTWVKFGATNVAADFAGVAIREVKQAQTYPATGFAYKAGQAADVLQRGSISVVVNVGTPTAGGAVYIRVAANGGNTIIGGFEAAADGANTVTLTGVKWAGGKDANNVAELVILDRQGV